MQKHLLELGLSLTGLPSVLPHARLAEQALDHGKVVEWDQHCQRSESWEL